MMDRLRFGNGILWGQKNMDMLQLILLIPISFTAVSSRNMTNERDRYKIFLPNPYEVANIVSLERHPYSSLRSIQKLYFLRETFCLRRGMEVRTGKSSVLTLAGKVG